MDSLCNAVKHYGPLLARILIAQLFVISALQGMRRSPRPRPTWPIKDYRCRNCCWY